MTMNNKFLLLVEMSQGVTRDDNGNIMAEIIGTQYTPFFYLYFN